MGPPAPECTAHGRPQMGRWAIRSPKVGAGQPESPRCGGYCAPLRQTSLDIQRRPARTTDCTTHGRPHPGRRAVRSPEAGAGQTYHRGPGDIEHPSGQTSLDIQRRPARTTECTTHGRPHWGEGRADWLAHLPQMGRWAIRSPKVGAGQLFHRGAGDIEHPSGQTSLDIQRRPARTTRGGKPRRAIGGPRHHASG
jgi:hypothetical protein